MIDLTKEALPDTITVNGRAFPVKTDFRVWLRFARCVQEAGADLSFLFPAAIPPQCPETMEAVAGFFVNPNPCPAHEDADGEPVFDYDADSEYIYAAFRQQYGLDLTAAHLHWHQFKALFLGLTDAARLVQIMQARGYEGRDKTLLESRRLWALPVRYTEEEQRRIDEFNQLF